MRIRYALVHQHLRPDFEALVYTNAARHHYDTQKLAELALVLCRPQLEAKLGLKGLRVRPIECDDTGKSLHTIFEPFLKIVRSDP